VVDGLGRATHDLAREEEIVVGETQGGSLG
jgi:hypothetical protein